MKDVLFYIAFCLFALWVLPRIFLFAARLILKRTQKKKAQSLRELIKTKQELAAAKDEKFKARINYEVVKGQIEKRAEKINLN